MIRYRRLEEQEVVNHVVSIPYHFQDVFIFRFYAEDLYHFLVTCFPRSSRNSSCSANFKHGIKNEWPRRYFKEVYIWDRESFARCNICGSQWERYISSSHDQNLENIELQLIKSRRNSLFQIFWKSHFWPYQKWSSANRFSPMDRFPHQTCYQHRMYDCCGTRAGDFGSERQRDITWAERCWPTSWIWRGRYSS